MQIFPCPVCGLRDETEFHYRGEAGILRPDGDEVSGQAWADYLYMRRNPRGRTSEIWHHLSCGEFFALTRDSVTHEVLDMHALGDGQSS